MNMRLSDDEKEAWEERVAICMYDGYVTREQAERIADEMVMKMRERRLQDIEKTA